MSSLAIIIIVVLSATLIYVWAKCQSLQKEVHSKENKENELKKLALVLQNINAYFLLIDKDFVVCDTNYYSLNRLPVQVGGVTKRVGDLLHCRNAIAAGECGQHEQCKLCCIRASIGKAFYKKASFKNLEASMKLLSEDEMTVTPCDVSVSGTYLNIHGQDYMVLTVYDVTELKNVQRLLTIEKEHSISAEKLKSAFIANMSHEVRTPLNAIVGFTNLLIGEGADEIEPEEKAAMIEIVNNNNELLLKLVNDVLEISRLDSGNLSFDIKEHNITKIIKEIYVTYQTLIQPSLCFILELDETVSLPVNIDCFRFTQVISNFLNNANKFTKEGTITLGCKIYKEHQEVCVYVKDTGKGIDDKELMMIFDRFYKTDEFEQGSGLGLSICKVIIERLAGRIEVHSEVGKGSCFSVILSLANII